MSDIFDIKPMKMNIPFTKEEVKNATRKLKNNKSAGSDNITAEQLKNAPDIMYEKIAEIYNNIAETGKYPDEIKLGILVPLQKPGKPKGKVDNLRPIILLNMIRKVLCIIMLNRLKDKINSKIPDSQSAYKQGRNTTENVFAIKIMIEKAMTMNNSEINVLLLDMSKAFDSVYRDVLIEDLQLILDIDELHIIKILIEDVCLAVRNHKTVGKKFKTNIGIPQGDCLSPILFTFYLANALKEMNNDVLVPDHLLDHDYETKTESNFTMDQQFADDLGWMSNSKQIAEI